MTFVFYEVFDESLSIDSKKEKKEVTLTPPFLVINKSKQLTICGLRNLFVSPPSYQRGQ